MERALKIDEQSYGPDHPAVARDLNNLARLYQATNRLAEAEPLERQAVVIGLKSTRAAGHILPNLKADLASYQIILGTMSLLTGEVSQRLADAGREAGYTPEEFAELLQQLGE
jgi:hypothetical protein